MRQRKVASLYQSSSRPSDVQLLIGVACFGKLNNEIHR